MNAIPLERRLARGAAPDAAARASQGLRSALRRAFAEVREWRRRTRGRAELARLDDRTLRDIGITRVDALFEINKPFWRD
jgi:uncharacterized protein YjiS (DUF1127 family)